MKNILILSLGLIVSGLTVHAQAVDHSDAIAALQVAVANATIQQGQLQTQNELLGGNVVTLEFAEAVLDQTIYNLNREIVDLENDETPFTPAAVPAPAHKTVARVAGPQVQ